MDKEKDKEEDIIEIFLLITDEDIEKAENKVAYIKSYKDVKKLVENYEGMWLFLILFLL